KVKVRKSLRPIAKRSLVEEREFRKYLEKVEDPNYQGGSWALPEKASLLEKTKYSICEKVIRYKRNNHLTTEKLAQKIQLTKPETEDILYCRLDCFTLDRLLTYTDKLFAPAQLKVTIKEPTLRRERTVHV